MIAKFRIFLSFFSYLLQEFIDKSLWKNVDILFIFEQTLWGLLSLCYSLCKFEVEDTLEIFLSMRYVNLHFTYLLTYWCVSSDETFTRL